MTTKPIDMMYIMNTLDYGTIGVAEKSSTLIDLLIDRGDLNSDTEIILDQTFRDRFGATLELPDTYLCSIADAIGSDWVEFVKSLTVDEFNEVFKYDFEMDYVAVYGELNG